MSGGQDCILKFSASYTLIRHEQSIIVAVVGVVICLAVRAVRALLVVVK